jgi:hypothetical protein
VICVDFIKVCPGAEKKELLQKKKKKKKKRGRCCEVSEVNLEKMSSVSTAGFSLV